MGKTYVKLQEVKSIFNTVKKNWLDFDENSFYFKQRHFHLTETIFQPPKWKNMNSLALQIRLWACFKTEEKPNCFLFFLFLILCHLFENKIVEFGKMQFNIQGIEIKYRFKDFWRYPVHNPENKNKYTVMKVIKTKKNVSKSDGLLHSNIMGDKLLLNSGAKFQR